MSRHTSIDRLATLAETPASSPHSIMHHMLASIRSLWRHYRQEVRDAEIERLLAAHRGQLTDEMERELAQRYG